MPQGGNPSSSRKKNNNNSSKSKKKKGRTPAHQNSFAFTHNPKSKKTAHILNLPNEHVCRRCHDKIEWRKQYRKYKPLTQPTRCNLCLKPRAVLAAYHTICKSCTTSRAAHEFMKKHQQEEATNETVCNSLHTETDERNEKETIVQQDNFRRVCAMCVREYALPDTDSSSSLDQAVQKAIEAEESKNRVPLKLRERKAIERRIHKQHEEAKRLAREARRKKLGLDNENDNEQEESEDAVIEEEEESDVEDDEDYDEDDPFLRAIGGADKLLVGEAYQRALLEKEGGD